MQCGAKWKTKGTLNFSKKLIWTEGKTEMVPIEIATTPRLQPFESEIVCINKALAFFFFLLILLSNASRSMSHIYAWNSGQWSWQNVIYWHWNVPDPRFTFPAFQAGFPIQWPFWTSRERANNVHGPQTARSRQVGNWQAAGKVTDNTDFSKGRERTLL